MQQKLFFLNLTRKFRPQQIIYQLRRYISI